MSDISAPAERISEAVNWVVERLCMALLVVLVIDVWVGILILIAYWGDLALFIPRLLGF